MSQQSARRTSPLLALVLLLLLLLVQRGSSAMQVFLSPSGNDVNACTQTSPCQSLLRAAQIANTYDQSLGNFTATLLPGVYPQVLYAGAVFPEGAAVQGSAEGGEAVLQVEQTLPLAPLPLLLFSGAAPLRGSSATVLANLVFEGVATQTTRSSGDDDNSSSSNNNNSSKESRDKRSNSNAASDKSSARGSRGGSSNSFTTTTRRSGDRVQQLTTRRFMQLHRQYQQQYRQQQQHQQQQQQNQQLPQQYQQQPQQQQEDHEENHRQQQQQRAATMGSGTYQLNGIVGFNLSTPTSPSVVVRGVTFRSISASIAPLVASGYYLAYRPAILELLLLQQVRFLQLTAESGALLYAYHINVQLEQVQIDEVLLMAGLVLQYDVGATNEPPYANVLSCTAQRSPLAPLIASAYRHTTLQNCSLDGVAQAVALTAVDVQLECDACRFSHMAQAVSASTLTYPEVYFTACLFAQVQSLVAADYVRTLSASACEFDASAAPLVALAVVSSAELVDCLFVQSRGANSSASSLDVPLLALYGDAGATCSLRNVSFGAITLPSSSALLLLHSLSAVNFDLTFTNCTCAQSLVRLENSSVLLESTTLLDNTLTCGGENSSSSSGSCALVTCSGSALLLNNTSTARNRYAPSFSSSSDSTSLPPLLTCVQCTLNDASDVSCQTERRGLTTAVIVTYSVAAIAGALALAIVVAVVAYWVVQRYRNRSGHAEQHQPLIG